jgi:3-oxoadipate enol-lactonase
MQRAAIGFAAYWIAMFVGVKGGRLHTVVEGSGPAIVMLHGAELDLRMWTPQVDALSDRFTVIRYDLRGLGSSNYTEDEPFFPHQDLHDLFDALELGRAHVMGTGLGARIALDFALVWPERVGRLLLSSPGISGEPADPEEVERLRRRLEKRKPPDAEELREAWLGSDYVSVAMQRPLPHPPRQPVRPPGSEEDLNLDRSLMLIPQPAAYGRLNELKAPTLVLVGERESPRQLRNAERLRQHGAQREVIAGTGHLMNLERPDDFNQATRRFLLP